MAIDQGLSGLSAAQNQLDVIGNNIANASTTGFKSGSVQFADVYANSLGGGGAGSEIGIGVSSSNVQQSFNQGTISTTNNPLDIAINGGGFFRVSTNGAISYTRTGQFQLDQNGNIVTTTGSQLTGYSASATGVLNTGVLGPLVINSANLPPKTTANVGTVLNLNSSSPVLTAAGFSPTNPATYTYSTSVSVYDSLGDVHSLQTYYLNNGVNGAGESTWNVYASVDGTLVPTVAPAVAAGQIATFAFNSSGAMDPNTSTPGPTPLFTFPVSYPLANGASTPQTLTMNYAGSTQYGSASSINSQTQDGFASGQLSQFSAGANGILTGSYTNGQTTTLGQIVLNNFVNPNGLQNIGNNQWVATTSSGVPLLGVPGNSGMGELQSSALENSNTDLTSELVNMITAQQNYQANAQTIKTADQMAQTLETLR